MACIFDYLAQIRWDEIDRSSSRATTPPDMLEHAHEMIPGSVIGDMRIHSNQAINDQHSTETIDTILCIRRKSQALPGAKDYF